MKMAGKRKEPTKTVAKKTPKTVSDKEKPDIVIKASEIYK